MAMQILVFPALHAAALTAGGALPPPQSRDLAALPPEEKIAFLTRMSPPPPDARTLAYAATALLVAAALLAVARRWRDGPRHGRRPAVLRLLLLASLLWSGAFTAKTLLPALFKAPRSFTREPYPFASPTPLEEFLRGVTALLPEEAGVMLVNCREPLQADMANYFLYPRRVIFTRYSAVSVPDPRAFLTAENRARLKKLGADWILDLDPRGLARGPGAALIPLAEPEASREGKGRGP